MPERIEKIKSHFKKNKKVYIAVGVTAAVSVATTIVVMKFREVPVNVTTVQKGYTVTGDIHNTINQIIEVGMSRPGPKSFAVQCLEDQRVWPSLRAAAADLNINPGELSKHLRGLKDSVKGMHFEKVAEL